MVSTEKILKKHNLRCTQIRKKVLSIFCTSPEVALAQSDLEREMNKADRVTLYRVLKAFEEVGIIHQVIDESNKLKYAMCAGDCDEHHHVDQHGHFFCRHCESTFCLDNIKTPTVDLPHGYVVNDVQLTFSGVCKDCHAKEN